MRGHHHAAVGDAAHGTCDLNRRDRQRLSKAHRAQGGAVILVTLLDDAQALARKIDTRAVTDAPLVHIGGKVVGTDLAPHQDKAHVGRTAHHLAHVHGHGIVALVGIGDGIVAHLDARRHLKRRTRSHDAQVEAGARHECLKDRAGLVGVGNQAQVHILGLGVFQIGLVVGRIRAGGENFAGRGVGDQSRAVLGLCLLDSLCQSVLSRTLDIDIERRHDINAVDRSHLFIGTARDIAAVPRALAYERTVRASQKLVVLLFETSQAVVVYIHYTQHLRCQIAVWIYALHGLLKKHAGQVLLLQHHSIVFVHLALDIHPGSIGLDELAAGLFIDSSCLDQRRHRLVNVLDKLRVHGDVATFDRRRQHVTVAVVDGATFGIEGLRKQAARIGTLAQFIGFDNLIVGKAKDAQAQAKPNESHDGFAARQRRACEPFGRRALARPGVMHLRAARAAKSRRRVVATGPPGVVRLPTRSLITRTSPRRGTSRTAATIGTAAIVICHTQLPSCY